MLRSRGKGLPLPDPAAQARQAGFAAVRSHGLFGLLLRRAHPTTAGTYGIRATSLARGGLVAIDAYGSMVYDPKAKADLHPWIWSISHVLTHLGLGHVDPGHRDGRGSYTPEWRAACCVVVDRFLAALDIPGTPAVPSGLDGDEEQLAQLFADAGIPTLLTAGPAGTGPDLWEDLSDGRRSSMPPNTTMWARAFATGLAAIGGGAGQASLHRPRPWSPTEEVRALEPPPPSWDAPLAAWFDERFAVLDARPTFGVVLDTAATMDHQVLERALGSIATTASARDVRKVRVVYCDDAASDAGWLPPDQIGRRLTARPRRGTHLQPAVDLLLADPAFPRSGPLLLISDGRCTPVSVHRDHAWLTSGHLPFTPAGPVFRL